MRIIKLSPDEHKIGLSIRALKSDDYESNWQNYANTESPEVTLGDHFRHSGRSYRLAARGEDRRLAGWRVGWEEFVAGGSMTKAALVEEVARVADLTKKHSEVIVETVFRSITDALRRGEKIELRGFGSFRLRRREPRKGRNPKTGDRVDVPSKRVPYFKPGKELKDLINRDREPARPAPPPSRPPLHDREMAPY